MTKQITRETLVYALRNKDTWPDGFEWYFATHRKCGLGLASHLLGSGVLDYSYVSLSRLSDMLNISETDAAKVFYGVNDCYHSKFNKVTPTMVADALEACPVV